VRNIPNAFQRTTLWTAITALSITVIGSLLVGLIYLGTQIISFLQPLLIPFAVAGVLAYLLEPVVARLVRWKISRHISVWIVFIVATVALVGVMLVIVPAFLDQSVEFAKVVPGYTKTARENVSKWAIETNKRLHKDYGVDFLHLNEPKATTPVETTTQPSSAPTISNEVSGTASPSIVTTTSPVTNESYDIQSLINGEWLQKELPAFTKSLWTFIRTSVGGFLGVFGFLISLVIVPLYLYYFLTEGPRIAETWMHYVPLRASDFKDEVVSTLTEINGYLIAFFRGQLVVSLINGVATGIGLSILGLKFGWLIGLSLCFLGIIPYMGIVVCWIPAVIIASVQGGSWLVHAGAAWWIFPLAVTGVFVVVQQVDGLFITPKIVGESVGLHPMTVIVSVFGWSLILGGLLGAILAVPMTAAVKVLFQRYIWKRAVESTL
jgi:predicted PurR-regulated permease PerM